MPVKEGEGDGHATGTTEKSNKIIQFSTGKGTIADVPCSKGSIPIGFAGFKLRSGGGRVNMRSPAPGIETKTGVVAASSSLLANQRILWNTVVYRFYVNSNNGTGLSQVNTPNYGNVSTTATPYSFGVANDYSACFVTFSNAELTSVHRFNYLGWLREPVYTGDTYPRGLVALQVPNDVWSRVAVENGTTFSSISTAADSITTPPINCSIVTPGADATDITIRDAASPHNPVGKLWNCIQLPATCNVGELWRNVGVDADGGGSEQDVYLCVMPWGTAKLGMRVWTEDVN